MQRLLRLHVGFVGKFLGIIRANVDSFFVGADLCGPAISVSHYAEQSSGAIRSRMMFNVLHIFGLRCQSQICQPVVRTHCIDVIYATWRPYPMHVEPCKSVCEIAQPINSNYYVPMRKAFGGFLFSNRPTRYFPSEESSIRVIMKKLFQAFLGDVRIAGSHEAPPSLSGERPMDVSAPMGFAYCSTGGI